MHRPKLKRGCPATLLSSRSNRDSGDFSRRLSNRRYRVSGCHTRVNLTVARAVHYSKTGKVRWTPATSAVRDSKGNDARSYCPMELQIDLIISHCHICSKFTAQSRLTVEEFRSP